MDCKFIFKIWYLVENEIFSFVVWFPNSMYTVLSVFNESLLRASHVDILCNVSIILISTSFQVLADVTIAVSSAYETRLSGYQVAGRWCRVRKEEVPELFLVEHPRWRIRDDWLRYLILLFEVCFLNNFLLDYGYFLYHRSCIVYQVKFDGLQYQILLWYLEKVWRLVYSYLIYHILHLILMLAHLLYL